MKKAYASTAEEFRSLIAEGFRISSIAYFLSGNGFSAILIKD